MFAQEALNAANWQTVKKEVDGYISYLPTQDFETVLRKCIELPLFPETMDRRR